jgi:CRISPR-associated endonuclease/helicase Cas3
MRPIDAALAGVDSLVLLDEAHLSRPLLKLAEQAAECDLGDPTKVVPRRSRPVIVPLTATGDREKGDDVFELGDEDLAHPVVQQRLSARKPLAMVECKRTTLSKTLAAEASRLHDAIPGAAVVVFANSPRTAREVARLLSPKKDTAPEVVLLTGLMREREADATRQRLLAADGGVASGRALVARPRSLTVVATQTLEVGADLDVDGLVTETAGVRALVQRLGRLNRLGARNDHADLIATAVLCHPTDTKDDGLYGKEPNDLWSHLVEKGANGTDLGPANAAAALEVPTTASGRSGELLPTHLWEMAKTTQPPPGEAPPEVFYDEIGEPDRSVAVAWRTWLPDVEKKERLEPPLIGTESVDVPLGALRELLEEREMAMVTVLDADRARLQEIPRDQLHPGHQVVLSSGVGGYGEDGWNLSSRVPVLDIGSLEASTLVVSSAAVSGLLAPDDTSSRKALDDLATQIVDEELDDDAAIAAEVVAILEAALPHPWLLASGLDRDGSASPPKWDAFIDGFRFRGRGTVHTEATLTGPALVKGSRSSTTRPHLQVAIDALDDLSFPAKSAALADHLGSVGAHARHIARQVGLTPELIDLVAQAGADHDLGKHDPRFQRWLGANPDEPLAKSGRRPDHTGTLQQASGWPRGGRHEALSGRILQAHDPHVDPLRLHLVLSHHGRGRPSFEPVADSSPTTFIVNMDGIDVEVDGDLSTVDWDQPARFRSLCEQYGVWGVALLEAIVRQADHQVSSVVEVV